MIQWVWDKVVYTWKTPSAFRDDWKAYTKNQLNHTLLLGFIPCLILGPAGAVAILTLFAIWEYSQWYLRRAEVSDCFEDWAFVAGGSFLGFTLDPLYGLLLSVFLLAGIFWRLE